MSLGRIDNLMGTPAAFANPPTITGIDPGQGQGPTLLVNSLLTFSSATVARNGNVLQADNGPDRGDGGGAGDGGDDRRRHRRRHRDSRSDNITDVSRYWRYNNNNR